MISRSQLLATITAGATGSLVATLAVGANLLLVVPATIGVGVIAIASDRGFRTRDDRIADESTRVETAAPRG